MKWLFMMVSFFQLVPCLAQRQAFNIRSFDGPVRKIYLVSDYTKDALTISCLKDTLHVKDFTTIVGEISILKNNFLKVSYKTRGGSGIHVQHTIILCVDNNRLYQALHVTSLGNEEFIDYSKPVDTANLVDEKSVYEVKLSLIGNSVPTYKLNLNIHNEKWSKHNSSTNHIYNKTAILKFDKDLKIFYNTDKNISHDFTIYDPKTGSESKQFIFGRYPAIILDSYSYYYIKGEWFEKNAYFDLGKFSYR